MKRLHLFEFEDFQWFPSVLRNYMTDFLQFVSNRFDIYRDIVPILETGLKKSNAEKIIDLASGGGGGLLKITERLKQNHPNLKVILTDYYPNLTAFKRTVSLQPNVFEFVEEKVNAMNVPPNLKGLRTQFLSLHHFKPAEVKMIFQNAVDSNSPIAIFEAQQRNVVSLILMLLSPLNVLLSTPFIRPFRFSRLFFTYLIPILPLTILWDGIVSALRTYTSQELLEITKELKNTDKFVWESAVTKEVGGILYLLGYPLTKDQSN
jgi:SAM-dependent methyltransferase